MTVAFVNFGVVLLKDARNALPIAFILMMIYEFLLTT